MFGSSLSIERKSGDTAGVGGLHIQRHIVCLSEVLFIAAEDTTAHISKITFILCRLVVEVAEMWS